MALSLCKVAAESAAEGTTPHLWSTALQGNTPAIDWSTCFFAAEIFISRSALPSVLRPWFGQSSQDAVRGSAGGEGSARPPELRLENASDSLHSRSLNQVVPDTGVPLYPSPPQTEVDRFWILIQSYRVFWHRFGGF